MPCPMRFPIGSDDVEMEKTRRRLRESILSD